MHPHPRSRTSHARARAILAAALALLALLAGGLAANEASGAPSQKNVLFILTDDMTFSELSAMPNVQSLLAAQGTSFNEAYVSFPLCCPSRATLMSGLYMHNHGVRGNFPPFGSWTRFIPHEATAMPEFMRGILDAGGLMPWVKRQMAGGNGDVHVAVPANEPVQADWRMD